MRQQVNQYLAFTSGKSKACSKLFSSGILIILILSPTLSMAEPASQVAWTPEILNTVKMGDAQAGKQLANSCVGCHGSNGISSNPEIPSLAGQLATYTYKQLMDYRNGNRTNMMMTSVTKNLERRDIINLATWYASLAPARKQNKTSDQGLEHSEKLVYQGDGKRIVPPCSVCHGIDGQGEKMDIPALAGQQSEYLRKTLMDYKQGERHNDIYSRMRLIASQLSEKEIEELGRFYYQFK